MAIDDSVKKVFRGYLGLDAVQQVELLKLLERYRVEGEKGRSELRESVLGSVTKMQTGPHGGGCPCCGR